VLSLSRISGCRDRGLYPLARLAKRLMKERKPETRQCTTYELFIQPMRHFFGKPGFDLMLKISGYGRFEDEAWNIFNMQCRMMAATFKKMFAL
jgi:hypothetical protein